MPLLLLLVAAAGAAYVIKQATTVRAPVAGSNAELAAMVLPSNFGSWIHTASPRQKEAVRAISQFQMHVMSDILRDDGRNNYWPEVDNNDPAVSKEAFEELDWLYRRQFSLPAGPPA